jgi:PAS domain S-box-containing protein
VILGVVFQLAMSNLRGRRRAESELKVTEDFKSRMLESSGDCVCVLDLARNILSMNADGQRRREVPRLGKVLNTSWLELWPGEPAAEARNAVGQARMGNLRTFPRRAPNFSGKMKWWDVLVTPIRGANGQPERLMAVSRDVTDTFAAEEKFRVLFESTTGRSHAVRWRPAHRLQSGCCGNDAVSRQDPPSLDIAVDAFA